MSGPSRNAPRANRGGNGLRQPSQIAIDKITVVPVAKIGAAIGSADDALLLRVNRALTLFLSIVCADERGEAAGRAFRLTAPTSTHYH